ncbi:CPBP family intramembrane glutamic endopeptidase [Roseicella aquatilis]|uniref:CPBP family intramembrane metalloprotease n=1 Tax=Roseicella aquatilis TaxID=2527868 RepID=A0A4R4DJ67_9PROT|nr:type II CAAX endopeptidase family protein [Roseicella aquatilis]TCZ61148.1 CPBP family intramembrane metalloprotease [Roseicella aquatilis]
MCDPPTPTAGGDGSGACEAVRGLALLAFVLLTFLLSVPFLLLGAWWPHRLLPGLPIAALMAVCPALAALTLVRLEQGQAGPRRLLRRALDAHRIGRRRTWALVLLLGPAITVTSYAALRASGAAIPPPQASPGQVLALAAVFLSGALAEELGWTGYATAPLRARLGPLGAGLVLGAVWALFHLVALRQAHRDASWIAWWSLYTIAARLILVWLYDRTGSSVLAASLFHATLNLGWQLFPVQGSHFDIRVTACVTAALAGLLLPAAGSARRQRRDQA